MFLAAAAVFLQRKRIVCYDDTHYGKGYSVRFYGITGRKRKGKQKGKANKKERNGGLFDER